MKCSPATGATLWYGDPYDGTAPMAKMALLENLPEGQAVVRPRADKLNLLASCATACHNGIVPKGFPKDNRPVPIPTMEGMLPELKDFQHGRGAIWCLDCHHITQRNKLVNHFGDPVDINRNVYGCATARNLNDTKFLVECGFVHLADDASIVTGRNGITTISRRTDIHVGVIAGFGALDCAVVASLQPVGK